MAGHRTRGHGRGIVRPDAQGHVPLTDRYTHRERAPAHGVGRRGSPSGVSYLGDLPWLSTTNGFGPVERNTSNGESAAGDGHPITLGGVVYAKGLGAHAPSAIEYYTGKRCRTVTADVGVDDEKGAKGTVAFEIWADGALVASTGVLTNTMPAQPVSADVTGAQVVRLVVTDGGDGVDSDHADWADARLTC